MKRYRRREFLWAAIAAGLAGWLLYRQRRARRQLVPTLPQTPQPRPGGRTAIAGIRG